LQFSPVAIVLTLVGILAVIVGIKGSGPAVFQTLTGHTTTPDVTTGVNANVLPGAFAGANAAAPASTGPFAGAVAGFTSPLVTSNPTVQPGVGLGG
jgi:hypothetical protein